MKPPLATEAGFSTVWFSVFWVGVLCINEFWVMARPSGYLSK